MTTVAIVQARMRSSRLPGKVLKKLGDKSAIEILLARLSKSQNIDRIIVATSENPENDALCQELKRLGYLYFRGSENNVLDRFYRTAKSIEAELVVRITGDCPLVQPEIVDQAIDQHLSSSADYTSNGSPLTFPDGLDVEVFSMKMLEHANQEAHSDFEREHVTPFMRQVQFRTQNFENSADLSSVRLTLDEQSDLELLDRIFSKFSPNIQFDYQLAVDEILNDQHLRKINQHIVSGLPLLV